MDWGEYRHIGLDNTLKQPLSDTRNDVWVWTWMDWREYRHIGLDNTHNLPHADTNTATSFRT